MISVDWEGCTRTVFSLSDSLVESWRLNFNTTIVNEVLEALEVRKLRKFIAVK